MPDYKKELKFARDIAVDAGNLLMKRFKKRHNVKLKGRVDLVTESDVKSEKLIVSGIKKNFPDDSILAEESGITERGNGRRWVIDPLDGTTNYAHNYPAFCVSIALEDDDDIVVGVIYNPILDELFSASVGGGAYLNRKRMVVTDERKLSRSLLATGFPYDIHESKIDNLENFARMYKEARGVRRAGSAALDLAYLACGRFDGFWELKLHPWDVAAGVLLVVEAGGRVTNLDGTKYSIYNGDILASNGKIHNHMKKLLAQ